VRAEVRRLLELLALTGLAVVQPLLDVLGRSTETFVFRGVEGREIVVFAIVVTLGPALALWVVGLVSRVFGPQVRGAVHLVSVGGLVSLAVLVGLRLAEWLHGVPALVVAIVAGLAAMLAYLRLPAARSFLVYLSPLPVLAAVLFLFTSSVSGLVTGGEVEVAQDVDATRPVVMMVLDEFPTATLLDEQGHIDAQQFPNLARLSRQATWFRNYTTHNAGTIQAVPSLLSGQLPTRGRAPLYTDWPTNLFTLLGGSYRMAVLETVTQLCPPQVCENGDRTVTQRTPVDEEGLEGLARDSVDVMRQLVALEGSPRIATDAFEEQVVSIPPPTEISGEANEVPNQPTRFRDFLAGLIDTEEPTMHFVHLILPHGPWRFFPDGTEYESPEDDPEGAIAGVWTDEWPAALTQLRLELQAEYTDAVVGQAIDRLHETGLWDRTLFVVVADHGGAFVVDEPGRALGARNVPEIMWTPLFIRSPGLAHGVNDANVQATDLLPTLADLLDIDLDYDVDGSSVVGRPDGGDTDKQYMRLQNFFQVEPDELVTVDGEENLHRLLTEPWPAVDPDDPVGAFYRRTPLGDLYGDAVDTLDLGLPADGSAHVDQLDAVEAGGDGPLPAFVGGTVDESIAADAWVVVALNGEVAAMSPLFPTATSDRAFSVLLAEDLLDRSGNDLELFVSEGPGLPLRPLAAS
jgi:Sulfatase